MKENNTFVEKLLKMLKRRRNTPDLHSAMCGNSEGSAFFVECNSDGTYNLSPLRESLPLKSGIDFDEAYSILDKYNISYYDI